MLNKWQGGSEHHCPVAQPNFKVNLWRSATSALLMCSKNLNLWSHWENRFPMLQPRMLSSFSMHGLPNQAVKTHPATIETHCQKRHARVHDWSSTDSYQQGAQVRAFSLPWWGSCRESNLNIFQRDAQVSELQFQNNLRTILTTKQMLICCEEFFLFTVSFDVPPILYHY